MVREAKACLDVKGSEEGDSSKFGISVYCLLIILWIKLTLSTIGAWLDEPEKRG